MKWLYYINYRAYEYYRKKGADFPEIYSHNFISTMIFFNITSIFNIFDIFITYNKKYNYIIFIYFALIYLLNYLLVYRKEKYKIIFSHMQKLKIKKPI